MTALNCKEVHCQRYIATSREAIVLNAMLFGPPRHTVMFVYAMDWVDLYSIASLIMVPFHVGKHTIST